MADVKDFEFDFSDLDQPVNTVTDNSTAVNSGNEIDGFDFSDLDQPVNVAVNNGNGDARYSENKNMNVTNQSGKKGYSFRSFKLADYYDFLTDESQKTYPEDYVKNIDSEVGINEEASRLVNVSSLNLDQAKAQIEKIRNDLFGEVVARQYLVLQAGGQMDKVPETKTRADLEAAFNALPGANYSEPRTSKNGKIIYKTQPCVVGEDGKRNFLWYSFASKGEIEDLNYFKNRFNKLVTSDKTGFYNKLLHFDEVKKALSEGEYLKLSSYNDLQKVTYNAQKLIDLDKAVSRYYDEQGLDGIRAKILESPDVLKSYVAEAQKHYTNIDFNGMVDYVGKNGNIEQRKGVVCSGGYSTMSQINELVSARRVEFIDKFYVESCRPTIIESLKMDEKKIFYEKVKADAFKKMYSEKRDKLTPDEINAIKDKVNNFNVSAEDLKKIEEKADTVLNSNRSGLGRFFTDGELKKIESEISEKVDAAIVEEKDRLARMSFEEVAVEINKLPVTESQKFVLNFINGVDTKDTENLDRGSAQKMIDDLTEQRRQQEVSPDIKVYAEKYHLVKPDEVYTNAKWNEDSKTVPPMDNIVKLAEDLNCRYQLVDRYDYKNHDYKKGENSFDKIARYEEIMKNGDKNGKKPLTQADFIDVVTTRYKDIDEKKNGPVAVYQSKAGFGMCRNWYEAEVGYLRKCCAEKLLGAVQAEYALNKAINPSATYEGVNLNDAYGIKGCNIDKLLDPKLTREQQLEVAESCREAVNKDMAQSYKDRIYVFEQGLTSSDRIGYFVKESLKKVCVDCKSVDDYVAKTKDPDVVLNGVKDFLQSSNKYYLTENNLKYVAKAYIERVPGIVETKGSKKEIMDHINARVDEILKPIAVAGTGNGSKGAHSNSKARPKAQAQAKDKGSAER